MSGEALKLFCTPLLAKSPLSVFHAISLFTARFDVMGKSRPPATRNANVLGNETGSLPSLVALLNECTFTPVPNDAYGMTHSKPRPRRIISRVGRNSIVGNK